MERKPRRSFFQEIMDEPIHVPGFPQIIATRGFVYAWLKRLGWNESERGYGSLDCTVFMPKPATEPLTPADERDYWLNKVEDDFRRDVA